MSKRLAAIHLLWTDRLIDDRQDDNGAIDTCSVAVAHPKIVYSIGLIINVRERKFHANFDVGMESYQERKFHLWNFRSPGMKVLGVQKFQLPVGECAHR